MDNPSSWSNAQSLAGANQIVLAWSERMQAIHGSSTQPLAAGANAQDTGYWKAIQQWLESNCTSFVDHVNGPLNEDETGFLMFTKETWQVAAGLNVGAGPGESFRRRIDPGDADSYGYLTMGDYRGPYCFEDIQKGLLALQWSAWPASCDAHSTKSAFNNGGDQPGYDPENPDAPSRGNWEWMKGITLAGYAACAPYHSTDTQVQAHLFAYQEHWFDTAINRAMGTYTAGGLPYLGRDWEMWLVAEGHDDWFNPSISVGCNWFYDTFGDFPISPADGVFNKVASGYNAGEYIDVPFGQSGSIPSWPETPAVGYWNWHGYTTRQQKCLLKWHFTP